MVDNEPDEPSQPQPRSLLRRHIALVLTTAALVTGGAYAYASLQQPTYTAHARVLIEPFTLPNAANTAVDMGTEQAIATSGAVLANAAGALSMSQNVVSSASDVAVSPNADVLDFGFSSRNRATASRGATTMAAAYMAYRAQTSTASLRTNVTQTLATPRVKTKLITSAARPGAPSSPDLVIDVLAGLLVGLITGFGVAFAADRFRQRLPTVSRWQEATGIPVLAGLQRDSLVGDFDLLRAGDRTAMALRYLRMRVSQLMRPGGAVLLVTEVREQPERAATARFLANALANTGWSSVLIEMTRDAAEPAKPKNPEDETATGQPTRPNDLRVRVTATPGYGDSLGAAGEWRATTVDGLMRLIETRRSANDVVVVTGPPVSTSVTTLDVAAVADVAVILDNVGTARREDALRVVAEVRATGCPIGGCVLLGLGSARTGDAAAVVRTRKAAEPNSSHGQDLPVRKLSPLIAWTDLDGSATTDHLPYDHANGSPR